MAAKRKVKRKAVKNDMVHLPKGRLASAAVASAAVRAEFAQSAREQTGLMPRPLWQRICDFFKGKP